MHFPYFKYLDSYFSIHLSVPLKLLILLLIGSSITNPWVSPQPPDSPLTWLSFTREVLKPHWVSESPRGLDHMQTAGFQAQSFWFLGLWWRPKSCTSNQLPGDNKGADSTLLESLVQQVRLLVDLKSHLQEWEATSLCWQCPFCTPYLPNLCASLRT